MNPAILTAIERDAAFPVFLRRLAEVHARALAGDPVGQVIVGEYDLARYVGVRPQAALALAEQSIIPKES